MWGEPTLAGGSGRPPEEVTSEHPRQREWPGQSWEGPILASPSWPQLSRQMDMGPRGQWPAAGKPAGHVVGMGQAIPVLSAQGGQEGSRCDSDREQEPDIYEKQQDLALRRVGVPIKSTTEEKRWSDPSLEGYWPLSARRS